MKMHNEEMPWPVEQTVDGELFREEKIAVLSRLKVQPRGHV